MDLALKGLLNDYKIIDAAFDRDFYISTYPDSAQETSDLVYHYLTVGASKGYLPRADFDPQFYLRKYPDVQAAGINPFAHYIAHGRAEGRLSHEIKIEEEEYLVVSREFDRAFYIANYPSISNNALDPVANFLSTGWKEGRRPQSWFDPLFYYSNYPDVPNAGLNPYTHYLLCGRIEGRMTCNEGTEAEIKARAHGAVKRTHDVFDQTQFRADQPLDVGREAIDPHLMFDADWYLAKYLDVAASGLEAFWHYWNVGAYEGRDPHPLFHSAYYVSRCQEDAQTVGNALKHYVEQGATRGLSPHPLFDREYYLSGNPHVATNHLDAFCHFVQTGDKEGRASHPLFDPIFYLSNNPDVASQGKGPLRHFIEIGGLERRNPHPMFDSQYYFWLYPEVAAERINPLLHYMMQPREARRHPHPLFDGGVQMLTSALAYETVIDPLTDYIQFRSHLDPKLVRGHATYIPFPSRAILPKRDVTAQRDEIDEPLVSILIPAYNSSEDYFVAAINSVRAQSYRNWEIVIVNDGSPQMHVAPMINRIAAGDKRIRALHLKNNRGISGATNEALKRAKGEYVALMDHDDVLEADAIDVMIRALLATDADAAYSDQAYLSAWNTFERTFYKPDWSPALFTGVMYVGHLLIVRGSVANAVEGFDSKFDRIQDYEFMLRVSEVTKKIIHIPRILYYWRMIPGSIAHDASSKGAIEPVQCAAVNAHFQRTGFPAGVEPLQNLPHRLAVVPKPREIYPQIDVVLRGDRPPEAIEKMRSYLKAHHPPLTRTQAVSAEGANEDAEATPSRVALLFAQVKKAIAASTSPFILFLDPLIDIVEPRWLDHLMLYAECDDVAFVAPHVYRTSGVVAAAGFIVSTTNLAPAMQGARLGEDGYAGSLCCTREVSALPASMIMIKRDVTVKIGLNSDFITPLYGFGDASIRAVAKGYRNIALAPAIVEVDDDYAVVDPETTIDAVLYRDLHARTIAQGDPFYNVNFPPGSADFAG